MYEKALINKPIVQLLICFFYLIKGKLLPDDLVLLWPGEIITLFFIYAHKYKTNMENKSQKQCTICFLYYCIWYNRRTNGFCRSIINRFQYKIFGHSEITFCLPNTREVLCVVCKFCDNK